MGIQIYGGVLGMRGGGGAEHNGINHFDRKINN